MRCIKFIWQSCLFKVSFGFHFRDFLDSAWRIQTVSTHSLFSASYIWYLITQSSILFCFLIPSSEGTPKKRLECLTDFLHTLVRYRLEVSWFMAFASSIVPLVRILGWIEVIDNAFFTCISLIMSLIECWLKLIQIPYKVAWTMRFSFALNLTSKLTGNKHCSLLAFNENPREHFAILLSIKTSS